MDLRGKCFDGWIIWILFGLEAQNWWDFLPSTVVEIYDALGAMKMGFLQESAQITTQFSVHSATVSWLMLIWSGVADCLLGTRNLGKSRFDSTPYLRLWMTAEVGEEHEDNTYLWLFCLAKLKEVIFQQRDFNLYCLEDLPDLVDPVKVRPRDLGSMLGYALIFKRYSRLSKSAPLCYLYLCSVRFQETSGV